MPQDGAGGTYKEFRSYCWKAQFVVPESPGVTPRDPLYDSGCCEGDFYGENIRYIATNIIQAEAQRFRKENATGRRPDWGRLEAGISTFVNDFLLLNLQMVSELHEAIVHEPHRTHILNKHLEIWKT
jgi:hypothetical protein